MAIHKVIRMTNRLLKKTDIDRAGLWLQPVGAEPSFAQEVALAPESVPSRQSSPAPLEPDVQGEQIARIRHVLHHLTTQLAHDKQRLLDELLPHVVRLAITIARRIVAAEIRQDSRVVERTVKAALDELACEGELQVHVHPDERTIVTRALEADGTLPGRLTDLRVIADRSIEQGGCVVHSDHGIIDANISTQFAQIQETLLAYLEQ